MAGAGYKLFNTGDVLTAAQVNTYLQEQTVMVFANSTARTTALSGVLAEGMMSYLQDTNAVEVYNGTSWTAVGGGGLTSPLTTKGDVWGYSTTNARIPVGSNGTVLTADSAETLGVKWAAPAGGGSMTQLATGSFSGTVLTLSSISTDYKDLRLVIQDWYFATDNNLFVQFNNVTTANYQNLFIRTGDSTVLTDLGQSLTYMGAIEQDNSDKNSFAMLEIYDYANTNTHKLCAGYGYTVNGSNVQKVGYSLGAMTSGTSAITRIDVFGSGSPSMTQGTYFLYGVK